jgi:hypothetical protein
MAMLIGNDEHTQSFKMMLESLNQSVCNPFDGNGNLSVENPDFLNYLISKISSTYEDTPFDVMFIDENIVPVDENGIPQPAFIFQFIEHIRMQNNDTQSAQIAFLLTEGPLLDAYKKMDLKLKIGTSLFIKPIDLKSLQSYLDSLHRLSEQELDIIIQQICANRLSTRLPHSIRTMVLIGVKSPIEKVFEDCSIKQKTYFKDNEYIERIKQDILEKGHIQNLSDFISSFEDILNQVKTVFNSSVSKPTWFSPFLKWFDALKMTVVEMESIFQELSLSLKDNNSERAYNLLEALLSKSKDFCQLWNQKTRF